MKCNTSTRVKNYATNRHKFTYFPTSKKISVPWGFTENWNVLLDSSQEGFLPCLDTFVFCLFPITITWDQGKSLMSARMFPIIINQVLFALLKGFDFEYLYIRIAFVPPSIHIRQVLRGRMQGSCRFCLRYLHNVKKCRIKKSCKKANIPSKPQHGQ